MTKKSKGSKANSSLEFENYEFLSEIEMKILLRWRSESSLDSFELEI